MHSNKKPMAHKHINYGHKCEFIIIKFEFTKILNHLVFCLIFRPFIEYFRKTFWLAAKLVTVKTAYTSNALQLC